MAASLFVALILAGSYVLGVSCDSSIVIKTCATSPCGTSGCTPYNGSCSNGTCFDSGLAPVACDAYNNTCGSSYCTPTQSCYPTQGACLPNDCPTRQRILCPADYSQLQPVDCGPSSGYDGCWSSSYFTCKLRGFLADVICYAPLEVKRPGPPAGSFSPASKNSAKMLVQSLLSGFLLSLIVLAN